MNPLSRVHDIRPLVLPSVLIEAGDPELNSNYFPTPYTGATGETRITT